MSVTTKNKAGTNVVYTLFRLATGGRTTLIGPDHSDASKDVLVINQKDPVAQKGESGYRRTEAEFQRTTVITEGAVSVKKIGRVGISSSLPVGMADDEIDELFARACEMAKQGTQQDDFFVLGKRPV